MKAKIFVFVGILFLPLVPKGVQAEVFQGRILSDATFLLGAEPEVTLDGDNDFSFFLHGGYGFGNGYDLRIKVGFGQSPFNDDDVHISGSVGFSLLGSRDGKLGLFMTLGASNWGDFSFENQTILYFSPGPFMLYTGIDDALRFQDNAPGDDITFPIEWVIGLDVPIRSRIHIVLEGGIELNDSSSFISGGIKAYF